MSCVLFQIYALLSALTVRHPARAALALLADRQARRVNLTVQVLEARSVVPDHRDGRPDALERLARVTELRIVVKTPTW